MPAVKLTTCIAYTFHFPNIFYTNFEFAFSLIFLKYSSPTFLSPSFCKKKNYLFLLYLTLVITALKVSVFGVILVCIFPHLDQNKSEYRHTFYAVCHLAINSDKTLIQFLKINRGHLPNDALITLLIKHVSEVFFTR